MIQHWASGCSNRNAPSANGETGEGSRGPNLHRPTLDKAPDDAALRKVIANGIPPEMPGAWQLTPHEVSSVAAFVKSLGAMPGRGRRW